MTNRIKNRLGSEQGFTLIELLVVIIILGILVAIAVPAYLSFTSSAHSAAAESNVRSAVPAAEDYYETKGSYFSMSTSQLIGLSPGVDPNITVSVNTSGDSYCLSDASSGTTYHYIGGQDASKMSTDPGAGQVATGACPTLT